MRIKSCNVQTNISSVIGNVTAFYLRWLKDTGRFPKEFFKDTYVSGTLASIENERKNIIKRAKPTLVVNPVYSGENGYMELLPYWHNTHFYTFKNAKQYYNGVFSDSINNIYIYGIPDRIKLTMQTKIILPTKIAGINTLHYLKNVIEPGGHGFINDVYFENEIPKAFIKSLLMTMNQRRLEDGKKELNMSNPDDRIIFENYLQASAFNGIIERRNLSTGKFEYAFKHKTNILANMDSVPSMSVTKRGRVDDMAVIDFEISLEFNTNSNFILEGPVFYDKEMEIERDEARFTYIDLEVNVETLREQEGNYRRRILKKFVCDVNTEVDNLPFGCFLDTDTDKYLKQYINQIMYLSDLEEEKKLWVLPEEIAYIKLYEDNTLLKEGPDFYVDWKDYIIYILHPKENVTYHFGFYLNMVRKNNEAKEKEDFIQVKVKKKI